MSLLDNPVFLADLDSDLSSRAVAAAYGIKSKSTVNEYRAQRRAARATAPAGTFGPVAGEGTGYEYSNTDGVISLKTPKTQAPQDENDALAIFRAKGLNPDDYTISYTFKEWDAQRKGGEIVTLHSAGAHGQPKPKTAEEVNDIDLPALYAEAARTKHTPVLRNFSDKTTVVVWADMQLGKVGGRGDTAGLVARMAQKRLALTEYLEANDTNATVFIDAGDPIEGFENVAAQMFTNDLSLPQQVDMAAVEMWKTLALMSQFGPVDAVAVPSNHGAWRAGKQSLGKPSDDWGLTIQSRLKFQAELVGLPVTFHKPSDWDESVAIDVRGTKLGVHHGHQAACDQMPKWWAGQQHGAQATADADVLVTGHYHHLRVQPTGRSQRTGKSKWWLQAPTLDNGSDWYRNRAGDDSDPGLLVFQINDAGFDLQSLAVL